jgi:DNA-binding MarR family transcriptional regulator
MGRLRKADAGPMETSEPADGEIGELADELSAVLARLYTFLRRAIMPKEMSLSQALALATLRDLGPRRVTELAEFEGVRQPTCTGLVNAMEAEGWVSRRSDGSDRRAVIVELTPDGRQILASMNEARSRLLERFLSSLSASDRMALGSAVPALERLIEIGIDRGLV